MWAERAGAARAESAQYAEKLEELRRERELADHEARGGGGRGEVRRLGERWGGHDWGHGGRWLGNAEGP